MKFAITVTYADAKGEPWVEPYDLHQVQNIDDAVQWAELTIAKFNRTLRPGERARKLLTTEMAGESTDAPHDFEKINLMTLLDDRMNAYDALQCRRCGITGRRYGLTNFVLDRKFRRAKKWLKCPGKKP